VNQRENKGQAPFLIPCTGGSADAAQDFAQDFTQEHFAQ